MNRPLISVLMGIYNCAETLPEAVQCILDQTYDNWELILCDDCSTDDTYQVALDLAQKDNRIVVLQNESNATLAPTLNHCLEHAKGKYIARMDGDDRCPAHRFQTELDFLQAHPEYGLVSCEMELFDAEGTFRTIRHMAVPQKKDFAKRSQFCHAGVMMRTDILRELNGYCTDKTCNRVEDYDLWIRFYHAGYEGYNLQEPLYAMRDDRSATSRRTFTNRINESRVKWKACRLFHLPLTSYVEVLIPIIKWMMPTFLYKFAHKH